MRTQGERSNNAAAICLDLFRGFARREDDLGRAAALGPVVVHRRKAQRLGLHRPQLLRRIVSAQRPHRPPPQAAHQYPKGVKDQASPDGTRSNFFQQNRVWVTGSVTGDGDDTPTTLAPTRRRFPGGGGWVGGGEVHRRGREERRGRGEGE